jgi:hypothetical protein
VGSVLQFILDCKDIYEKVKDIKSLKNNGDIKAKYGADVKKQMATTITTDVFSMSAAVANFTNSSAALANSVQAISNISQIAQGAGAYASGVGSLLGAVQTVRAARQAVKSKRRLVLLKALKKKAMDKQGQTHLLDKDTQRLLGFAVRKAHRKWGIKTATAVTASVSCAGSTALLLTMAVLGATNIWNPIGWGFCIAASITGAGILCYRIHRKRTSKERAEKRGFKPDDFPKLLVDKYLAEVMRDGNSVMTLTLAGVLAAYGVSPLRLTASNRSISEAQIARHLKSS